MCVSRAAGGHRGEAEKCSVDHMSCFNTADALDDNLHNVGVFAKVANSSPRNTKKILEKVIK